jgi:hypothetical protein
MAGGGRRPSGFSCPGTMGSRGAANRRRCLGGRGNRQVGRGQPSGCCQAGQGGRGRTLFVSCLAPNAPQIWGWFGEKWAIRGERVRQRFRGSVGCSFWPSNVCLDKKGPMGRIWDQRWRCSKSISSRVPQTAPDRAFGVRFFFVTRLRDVVPSRVPQTRP